MESAERASVRPDRVSAYKSGEAKIVRRKARFVFFSMLLFAALSGLFSAVAFAFGDIQAATWLAMAGLFILAGVIWQMLAGLTRPVRIFYALCAGLIFCYIILRGGLEHMSLLGALALVPGFVVVLGWRLASGFLLFLGISTAVVFWGDYYLISATAFPLVAEVKFIVSFAGLGVFCVLYGRCQEVSINELITTNRMVNALAYKDPLTGLPNRRAIEDILEKRWEEFRRTGHHFSVLLCNIDNFKTINHRYGHDFGDGVLLRLTNVLIRGVRSQDLISRWSGDEFLLVLPAQDQSAAIKVAERLLRRVADIELAMLNEPVLVTVSIGVSCSSEALDAGDVVSIADSGLFQAKHTGKNKVVAG